MIEQNPGYGNEPLELPYENGKVISADEYGEYSSQDEHFEAVDRLSDLGVANYADAAQRVGYDPLQYDADGNEVNDETDARFTTGNPYRDPNPGVSVTLQERKDAVWQLMDGISVQNRYFGASRNKEKLAKYKSPDGVLSDMGAKAERYRRQESHAVEMLAKAAMLRAVGFTEIESITSQAGINRKLSQFRGTGAAAVRLRNKQKEMVAKTAEIVTGR